MKGTDKFLIAIVAGVVVLVAVVLVLAVVQPNRAPSYQPDDTPEGVAHNYLLALHLEEYERAYSYLSSTLPSYPGTTDKFMTDLGEPRGDLDYDRDIALAVESVDVDGDEAKVVVRETEFYRGGLFDSGQYSNTFDMTLRRVDGAWKISDSGRYWAWCWQQAEGCP